MSKITNEQIWNKLLEIEQLLKNNKSSENQLKNQGKLLLINTQI